MPFLDLETIDSGRIVTVPPRARQPGSGDNTGMSDASSSAITCQFGAAQSADVDLLVLPWFEGEAPSAFDGLDRAASGEISRALNTGEFTGRPYELFVTPLVDRAWKPRRVALIGAGQEAGFNPGLARRL